LGSGAVYQKTSAELGSGEQQSWLGAAADSGSGGVRQGLVSNWEGGGGTVVQEVEPGSGQRRILAVGSGDFRKGEARS